VEKLSVVIPVYNEAESLPELHAQLDEIARRHDYPLQVVFVDDGSRDDTWKMIEALAEKDERVEGIRFRRNFGKAAALSAGFRAVRGDVVMTLDADLQDDPAEIPRFVELLEEEQLDLVSGWKKRRFDPWHKVWASRVFNGLVSRITGVKLHDHNCGAKCYRVAVTREVELYGEHHRFVPVLAAARGFTVGELVIEHRPRKYGRSKYGFERFIKGFLDLLTIKFLTGFGHRPQHLLGGIGIILFLLGVFGMTYLAAAWGISRLWGDPAEYVHLHNRAALYYSLALLIMGGQFLSVGLLGELITSHRRRGDETYAVSQRVGGDAAADSQPGGDADDASGSGGASNGSEQRAAAPASEPLHEGNG